MSARLSFGLNRYRLSGWRRGTPWLASCVAVSAAMLTGASARGDVVFGDFESGTAPGFGALTSSMGVQPWTSPVNGTIITAPSGPLAGSKVLELTGTTDSFNFGYSGAAALGFNFLSQSLRSAWLANDQLEFDWYPVPNGGSGGYSQLYNVVVNSQGGGWGPVDGYSFGNDNFNQFYYTGYNGILHHLVVNYSAYKDAVLASGNPDGGGWLELAIQPNAGGGAPADYYFDNFKLTSSTGPTNAQWNVDADGNWSVGGNWTPSAPNASGAIANFGAVITAPRTVTVDSPQTTGQLNFNNANKYTIAGSSTLTLDNTSGGVNINVAAGSHDITAPLALAKNATFTVTPSASESKITNLQPSTVGITKDGAGTARVNNFRAASLTVSAGTAALIAGRSTAGTSNVQSLSVAAGATLDLHDQDMVINYSGGSPLATIQALIASGYNGGAWTGTGIRSTSAAVAAGNANKTALGYAEASAVGLANGVFSGQNVGATAVLIRYTYYGDANLDGSVDTTDFNNLAANFSQGGKTWSQGDFNNDGTVDTTDFNLLASNFSLTLATPSAASNLVPEPTSLALIGIGGVLACTRRRRAVVRW